MIFVDQDGRQFIGRLELEAQPGGQTLEVLILVPRQGEARRFLRHEPCPFLLAEAALDEVARLDRAEFHFRRAPRGARRRS